MSYINFRLPDATVVSVDFVVYSDVNRIADSGYHLLETTEKPLATLPAQTFDGTKAAEWHAFNKKMFEPKAPGGDED